MVIPVLNKEKYQIMRSELIGWFVRYLDHIEYPLDIRDCVIIRSMFTTIAFCCDLIADTAETDLLLSEAYNAVAYYSRNVDVFRDFESFENYMIEYIV